MPQSFVSLNCHIIFGTKNREATITPEIEARLHAYIGGAVKGQGCVLLKAGGTEDHVHLLVSLGREMAVATLLREIEAGSSKWIHQTFSNNRLFGWQDGYAAFSVSHSALEKVKEYIEKQKEHHRKLSFRDEVIAFLKKHHIAYDERYMWK